MRYAKLLDPRKALDIALSLVEPVDTEEVRTFDALGRVIAENIVAKHDHPPFDRSAVDGYAVIAQDTYGAMEDRPIKLRKTFSVAVGERPKGAIHPGETAYVATGAPIPPNSNAVIPIEFVVEHDDYVEIMKSAYPGMNVHPAASDIARGEHLIRTGTRLSWIHVSMIASQGLTSVKVYRRPKAIVLGIGNELVEVGTPLEPGKLYESNTFAIGNLLKSLGFEVERKLLRDDEDEIRKALSEDADIYVTIGGTSKGLGDLTYKVVEELGEVIYHGLMVKPGKPTFFALVNDKPLVGLPGFPGSCMFMSKFLLEPVARKLSGERLPKDNYQEFILSREITNDTGRYRRIPIRLYKGKAVPIPRGSGDITLLAMADGMILLDPWAIKAKTAKGRLRTKKHRFADVVTSHDPALIAALDDALVIPSGSTGALHAVMFKEADFGGIHILTDNGYNFGLGVRVIRGYDREIGFVLRDDVDFSGRQDLTRVRFINRNVGSGTRILIDKKLKELNIDPKEIEGYRVEVKSHNAVAAAVASGRADVGIAIRRVAEEYGLRFIPIGREEFDFAVNDEEKLYVYAERIKQEILTRKGYRLPQDFMKVKDEGGRDPAGESSRGGDPSSSPPLSAPFYY